ncbi:MAG: methylenetetrahydrofolate reductase [Candidatus Promineifilaceae bacterium]
MKLTEMWKNRTEPTLSFELFPARTEKAAANLEITIDMLSELMPDFVSVTFGAGGSTREGSRQLIQKLKHIKGLDVVAYFACYGLDPEDIVSVLNDYQDIGVQTILAVRGDEPREEGFVPHPESLPHASDLVSFIRPRYEFCIGVAGYPEGHIEAASNAKDLDYLKLKVDQGAEFIIANYFYDNNYFFDYVDRCRNAGINVPILPGIMPVYSVKMMGILAGLCGATITDELSQGIDALPQGDTEALLAFGIDFAYRQCAELLKADVPGLHIYTMDRWKSPAGVVTRLRAEGLM